jgi:hypothetical protein
MANQNPACKQRVVWLVSNGILDLRWMSAAGIFPLAACMDRAGGRLPLSMLI